MGCLVPIVFQLSFCVAESLRPTRIDLDVVDRGILRSMDWPRRTLRDDARLVKIKLEVLDSGLLRRCGWFRGKALEKRRVAWPV